MRPATLAIVLVLGFIAASSCVKSPTVKQRHTGSYRRSNRNLLAQAENKFELHLPGKHVKESNEVADDDDNEYQESPRSLPGSTVTPQNDVTVTTRADMVLVSGNLIGVLHYYHDHFEHEIHNNLDAECNRASKLCIFESFVTTTAVLYSFLCINLLIAPGCLSGGENKYINVIIKLGYVFAPLLIVMCALCFRVLGYGKLHNTAGWCWISECDLSWNSKFMWMLFTGKSWEILTYVSCGAALVSMRLHRVQQNLGSDSERRAFKWVFTAFLVARMWGTYNWIFSLFVQEEVCLTNWWMHHIHEFLITLHGIGDSSQGWINFIGFCILWDDGKKLRRQGSALLKFLLSKKDRIE